MAMSDRVELTQIGDFFNGNLEFSQLQPMVLERPRDESAAPGFYLGLLEKKVLFLRYPTGLLDRTLVVPGSETQKGQLPYYWLDFFNPPFENLTPERFPDASCRLKPYDLHNPIDLMSWHGLGEQLLADYLLGKNGIAVDDLIPFSIYLRSQTTNYNIAAQKELRLRLFHNPKVKMGDTLRVIPHHDEFNLYRWIDVMKIEWGALVVGLTGVGSYRLFPELGTFSALDWQGPESQMLVDYLSGKAGLEFKDLLPIRKIVPPSARSIILALFRVRNNLDIRMFFPPGVLSPGEEVIVLPKQDDQGYYQWLELYRYDPRVQGPTGECLASGRLLDGKLEQSKWPGAERQLLVDFMSRSVPFENLRPIPLKMGKTVSLGICKSDGQKIYVIVSKLFGLKEDDELSLVPEENGEDGPRFLFKKGEIDLGRYRLDLESKLFQIEDVFYQAEDIWFDKKTQVYVDTDGEKWIPITKLSAEFSGAIETLRSHLQKVETITYRFNHNVTLYKESEARRILIRNGLTKRDLADDAGDASLPNEAEIVDLRLEEMLEELRKF